MHDVDDVSGRVYDRNARVRELFTDPPVDADQAALDTATAFQSEVEAAAENPPWPSGHMVPRRKGDPIWPRRRYARKSPAAGRVRAAAVVVACLTVAVVIGLKLARVI